MRDAELAGKRCLVVGLGRFGGGAGAVRWAVESGLRVCLTDRADADALAGSLDALGDLPKRGSVELRLGGHEGLDPADFDLVVANPAIPPAAPLLRAARAAGVRVTSEVELWLERTPARIAAVTGTQGKSSTVTFLGQLLSAAGIEARVGGNLGGSLLGSLTEDRYDTTRVVELSSYQLEGLGPAPRRAAEVVAVTNVLVDHLERHGSLDGYAAAKRRLLEICRRGGAALLPTGGPPADWRADHLRLLRHGPGGWAQIEGTEACVGETTFALDGCRLPAFQRANVVVALAVALELGADPAALTAALPTLAAPAHRCQRLPEHRGRVIIDNGVATTPDATLAILDALDPESTLLLGGQSKGLPWGPLVARLAERGDRVVAFGAAAAEVARACAPSAVPCSPHATLEEAVEAALEATASGSTVAFSPSCASFDAYANFEERARAFLAALDLREEDCVGGTGRPGGGV